MDTSTELPNGEMEATLASASPNYFSPSYIHKQNENVKTPSDLFKQKEVVTISTSLSNPPVFDRPFEKFSYNDLPESNKEFEFDEELEDTNYRDVPIQKKKSPFRGMNPNQPKKGDVRNKPRTNLKENGQKFHSAEDLAQENIAQKELAKEETARRRIKMKAGLTVEDLRENNEKKENLRNLKKEREKPTTSSGAIGPDLYYQINKEPLTDHKNNTNREDPIFPWKLTFQIENGGETLRASYEPSRLDVESKENIFSSFVTVDQVFQKVPKVLNPIATLKFWALESKVTKKSFMDESYVRKKNILTRQQDLYRRSINRRSIWTWVQQIRSKPRLEELVLSSSSFGVQPEHTEETDCIEGVQESILSNQVFNEKHVVNTLLSDEEDIRIKIEVLVDTYMISRLKLLLEAPSSKNVNSSEMMISSSSEQTLKKLLDYFETPFCQRDHKNHPLCAIGRFQPLVKPSVRFPNDVEIKPKSILPNDPDSMFNFCFSQVDSLTMKLRKSGYYHGIQFKLSMRPGSAVFTRLGRPYFFDLCSSLKPESFNKDKMYYRTYVTPFMMEFIRKQFALYNANYLNHPRISCITIDLFALSTDSEPIIKPSAGNALSCGNLYDENGRLIQTRAEIWLEHLEESIKQAYTDHSEILSYSSVKFRIGFWTRLSSSLPLRISDNLSSKRLGSAFKALSARSSTVF